MPGTNLTREEAATRAALLSVTSYTVDLDLSGAPDKERTTFGSVTTIEFGCAEPGADTFADLVGAEIHEITLNGEPVDPAAYADSRIALTGLREQNVLTVRADCTYSRTGEGLHRFFDPSDDRVYLYSQFEVPDARRVYTTFEQPDLKAPFTFTVTAPAHWKVVSNAPTPEPVPTSDGVAVWSFPPTKPMSTYITAVIAGEYHEVLDSYEGKNGTIPLGHYCRQALVEHLDRDEIVLLTKQGFEFFEEAFGYPYPFEKYDQLYVPEYNAGAMENAGCVTLRDEYLPRSRQDKAFYEFRCSVILHEMAHMWFGDLVTMKWWDDLWLNESFAEWACYHAAVENTAFTESWTGFTNARKNWALRQDQLPSTHPVAADNYDLEAVEVNFDGITYAKGASVLKQLVFWVGLDNFLAGLKQYFQRPRVRQRPVRRPARCAGEGRPAASSRSGPPSGCRPPASTRSPPSSSWTPTATTRRSPSSRPRTEDYPTLRRHRIGIGLYDDEGGRLVRRSSVEVDIAGASTEIAELVGQRQPDLLLLNDGDLTYAKIRLDERSLATVVGGLSRLDDSLARALCWGAAWDMTRDAEMTATDYVRLVLANVGSETDAFGTKAVPGYAAMAVHTYAAPEHRAELWLEWEQGLRKLLESAEPGSDHQLTFARAYAAAAHTDQAIADLEALLDGSLAYDGLAVDADLRWLLLNGLARTGHAEEERIAAELANDNTISGQEHAAACRAARPTAEAKAAAWEQAMVDPDVPNETHRNVVMAFNKPGQAEVLQPYVEKYLASVASTWERLGAPREPVALERMFPRILASAELLGHGRCVAGDGVRQPGRAAQGDRGPGRRGPSAGRSGEGRRARLTP